MLNNHICAVDIGSSKISAVLAQIKNKHISRLFFESGFSKGIEKGMVVDSVELIQALEQVLKNLRVKSGINFKLVYANLSGKDIITKHSRAIIPLAERGNKVVTISDIQRANEQARILGSSLEEEIIHQIAYGYSIDSKENIIQPLGLYSHKLEVDLYLVCAKLSSVQTLSRVISQSGFEAKNLFFSGIATSKAVFGPELEEGINLFCDIGGDITEILIFNAGLLKEIKVLLIGGNDLTEEIGNVLKIPFELAEDVKKSHFISAGSELSREDKEILIKKDNIYKPIKQKIISEILTSKVKSIAETIKGAVEKESGCSHIKNFVVAGRVVLSEDFLEIFEATLGIPVRLARIVNPELSVLANKEPALSGQKYLNYLTSLGMILQVIQGEGLFAAKPSLPSNNLFFKAVNKAKEVYQEYF